MNELSQMLLVAEERRPRHAHDVYNTPPEFARRGLALLADEQPRAVLDVGAGEGVWGHAARERWPQVQVSGIEIRDVPLPRGYLRMFRGDYRYYIDDPSWDLIMGNPPFCYAEEFVRLSLAHLAPGGCLLFMLRLAFLESKGRANGLFREHPPELVAVCADRPRFYGTGSGMTAMCFVKWRKGHSGDTRLIWSRPEDADAHPR